MARRTRGSGPAQHDRTRRRRVWDRLHDSDPGWARARASARAVLAAAVGGGATLGVAMLVGWRVPMAALAVVVALFGGALLPAPAQRPAHLWRLAASFTVSAVVTASLTPWPLAARAALLVAIGVGAWLGRGGQPGTALGLLVFLASFFALLLGATPDDTPAVGAAGLLGTAGLAVTERLLLPDRPAVLLRRLARSLVARASLLVDAAEVLAREGPGSGRQRRLRRRLVAVQEVALLVGTTLEDPVARASAADPDALGSDVLVVEALADHLVWAVLSIPPDTPPVTRAEAAAAIRRARVPGRDVAPHRVDPLVPRLVGDRDDRVVEVLERLAAAVVRLQRGARETTASAPAARTAPDGRATAPAAGAGPRVVQAVLAGGLAMGLGSLVDPAHWYWAVVGAYVVVATTSSRGAGLRKAADRLAGTTLGVVAGLGVAALVAGHASVELVVLLALLFAMFWVMGASYLWQMFLLTVTVAVLYELTGRLSVEFLALRVAETALGVGIGALVVFFVLPTPTRATVDGAVDDLLAVLDRVLATVGQGPVDEPTVRQVDHAVSTVRATTAPLSTPVGRITGEVRAARLLATAVRVRTGALATVLATDQPSPDDLRARDVVRDHLARLRAHLATPGEAEEDPRSFPASDGPVGPVLQAIDDRLTGYATARGLALRPDPGALTGGTPRWRD